MTAPLYIIRTRIKNRMELTISTIPEWIGLTWPSLGVSQSLSTPGRKAIAKDFQFRSIGRSNNRAW